MSRSLVKCVVRNRNTGRGWYYAVMEGDVAVTHGHRPTQVQARAHAGDVARRQRVRGGRA